MQPLNQDIQNSFTKNKFDVFCGVYRATAWTSYYILKPVLYELVAKLFYLQ